MTTGERLRRHIKKSGVTQAEFARLLGVTTVALSFVMSGRRSPGRDLSLDIEAATAGSIRARDWRKDEAVRAA